MNQQEQDKFNASISSGYKELITKRPGKPLEHFIYYILTTLPQSMRDKDETVLSFFKNYQENEAPFVKDIWNIYINIQYNCH